MDESGECSRFQLYPPKASHNTSLVRAQEREKNAEKSVEKSVEKTTEKIKFEERFVNQEQEQPSELPRHGSDELLHVLNSPSLPGVAKEGEKATKEENLGELGAERKNTTQVSRRGFLTSASYPYSCSPPSLRLLCWVTTARQPCYPS